MVNAKPVDPPRSIYDSNGMLVNIFRRNLGLGLGVTNLWSAFKISKGYNSSLPFGYYLNVAFCGFS